MKRLLSLFSILIVCASVAFCGINNTLNEAQQMFTKATTVEQYQAAKKKFQSAKYDVGYVAAEHDTAINEGIRKCDNKINSLSPRLTVDGYSSSLSISFGADGGNRSFEVLTNQGLPSVSGLPSWITTNSVASSSVSIKCASNSSTSSRSDYFYINAGSKSVKVNVTQSGKSAAASSSVTPTQNNNGQSSKSATIERVWTEDNIDVDGVKGLGVHVKFSTEGMLEKDGRISAYFYDSSGNALVDQNGSYKTTDGKVSSGRNFKPGYESAVYNDYMISIPYSELHLSGEKSLLIDVIIWDKSVDPNVSLARKDDLAYTYRPSSGSYLYVDNKTAVSTSFPSSGGTETFTVSTDAGSWTTWGIPSFCEVTNRTSTSFTLKCNANNTGSARSDYMKIKTDGQEVRIDISQSAGNSASATVNRVWVDHNEYQNGLKGMLIHVDFETKGIRGHDVEVGCFFEFANGTPLKDYDGQYKSPDGQVAIGKTDDATYENTHWSDFKLFMPHNQLHMSNDKADLRFKVQIYDLDTRTTLAVSDYYNFTWN